MKITEKTWAKYVTRLSKLNEAAGQKMADYITAHGTENTADLIAYAYAVISQYGEGSAELACQMYDAIAAASGADVPPAEPAAPADYSETAKMINATRQSPPQMRHGVSRLVKRAAADTTLHNAARDGAEWAWVPHGDTCPFCITLASNGWQKASDKVLKGGHAQHIHANCDCEFAIRFNSRTTVAGYDPEKYLKQYRDADGDINTMRRVNYAANKEHINAQKRAAYAERKLQGLGRDDIIETDKTVIQARKLTEYLLKPGTKHFQEFLDVGYTEHDFQQLASDIAAQYSEDGRFDFKTESDGTKRFSVLVELGIKTHKTFQTVWRIDSESEKPRLITCYRVSVKKGGEKN